MAKVIHTSSSAVFGVPKSNPVMPTTVPSPMEAYGHAKLAAEWACLAAARDGLDVSIVRPRTILGHGRLGIFGILFDWIADGYDPIVLGDGTNRYQFVHSDDLADACVRAAATEGPDIFNVGTDRFGTMRETLADLCEHAGTGVTVRSLPAAPAALGMRLSAALGISPFAPYHWLMYSKSMWFDLDHLQNGASPGARPGRPPTCSPRATTGSSPTVTTVDDAGASHHRRSARQGVLSMVKRWSSLLPEADVRTSSGRWLGPPSVGGVGGRAGAPGVRPRAHRRAGPDADRTPSSTCTSNPGRFLGRHDRPRSTPASTPAGCRTSTSPTCGRSGPWFWFFERLGVPDWVAHRLWVGHAARSPPDSACAGWRGCSGSGPTAALAAAIVYQLSPYILPYVSRTSILLLPFAGLGLDRRPHRAGGAARPVAVRRRASRSWCSPSARSTPPRWR